MCAMNAALHARMAGMRKCRELAAGKRLDPTPHVDAIVGLVNKGKDQG